ncbi:MAG: hypothetical protein AAFY08_13750 [Planctomycetota bacterium]
MPDNDAADQSLEAARPALDDTQRDHPAIPEPTAPASAQAVEPAPGYTPPAQRKPQGLRGKLANLFNWSRSPVDPEDPQTRAAVEVAVARRDASLLQLKEGYTDAVDTMAAVRRHMDEQARRSDRVIELLEGLPDILRAMPESAEKQARILEHIQGSLERQHDTTKSLSTALQSATESQKQVSSHLKAQLDASNQSRLAMRDTLGTLTATMSDVTASNAATRDAFVQQAADAREMFAKHTRHTWVMIGVIAVIAVASLGGLAYIASTFQAAANAGVATPTSVNAAAEPTTPAEATPAPSPAEPAATPEPVEAADQPEPLTSSDLPAGGF